MMKNKRDNNVWFCFLTVSYSDFTVDFSFATWMVVNGEVDLFPRDDSNDLMRIVNISKFKYISLHKMRKWETVCAIGLSFLPP